MGTQGKNKHSDPILLLQFMNVLYMVDIFVKFEKIWIVHPFQGNYLKQENTVKMFGQVVRTNMAASFNTWQHNINLWCNL